MTTDTAQREYLSYLESLVVRRTKSKKHPFGDLLSIMHDKEYVWIVPNDDNRIADGIDIRLEWADENGAEEVDSSWASFLEVLIGLSRHLAFFTGESAEGWAWQLVTNLDLHTRTDRLFNKDEREVDEILDACIWRTYSTNGQGGFFPLNHPHQDQKEVEVWYQLQAYLKELHPEM